MLWEQMKEAGYGGKMLRLIQRMHDETKGVSDWGGGGGGGGVRQMVITEGDDYKYLGVMVFNLGVVRTSGVTMGGETIVRKAQVQAVVVRDEIRDGYDRIL